ncbi:MFS transporter [Streptomyces sp. B3I8]|uniref:MFS transporter n=1 Tax=Streptomyces sp. B3I8 TaxID=3042303 RepID=UPI002788C6AD|nr:MFS transporter [Streptomyces sp. B3I8]MDQ0789273.1 putative MFS family arabinose efflux permease [Streptomyces sp. B3I8]
MPEDEHSRQRPFPTTATPENDRPGTATPENAHPPADTAPGAGPGGYTRVLRIPEYRAVFVAHTLSLLGVVVSEIALSVLVYDLTGSPLLSALTFALGFLPYLVGGTLFAGVADRFPARRVLVVCDLVCAACVAVMAVPGTRIGVLLALRCALAVVSPVFQGTRMATLTDVLGDGDLFVLGRSLLRIVSQTALLSGYGCGGLLLTVLTPRHALLITVATFLSSALLLRLGTRRRPARAGRGGAPADGPLTGARRVLADRRTRVLLLLFWVPPMFCVVPEALAAPYADRIGAGSTGLGLLMCALPIGTIAGELFAGARLRPATRERVALPLICCMLLPYLGFALAPGLGWTMLLLVLTGAGSAYTLGLDQWFVAAVPKELRGRAMTLNTAGLMTVQGIGMALAGVVAQFAGVPATVAGAGAIGTLTCVLLAAAARRGAGPADAYRKNERPNRETGLTSM